MRIYIFDEDISMKISRTVILWGREDVLGKSVEFFLNKCQGWEVIRVTDQQSIEDLYQEVIKTSPEAIILNQGDSACDTRLPLRLMQSFPGLKVITVSLEDNLMEIYSKQKVCVKNVSDLLSVVEGCS